MPDLQLTAWPVGRSHRNHGLFSDHYLDSVLPTLAEWGGLRESAQRALDAVLKVYTKEKDHLPRLNESQLEARFIRPVLEALGHEFETQVRLTLPSVAQKPDYVFYASADGRQQATGVSLTEESLRRFGGIAVGDAKAWSMPLDRGTSRARRRGKASAEETFSNANPSYQIAFYVQHSGMPWGILTNGKFWRLYHRDTAHRLDRYYEVDLEELLQAGNIDRFLYFFALFAPSAFRPGPVSLESVLDQSVDYARALGASLRGQVFPALRHIAQGFLDHPANKLEPTAETLAEVYRGALVVLYRTLFVAYAEARGLLPLYENETYTRDHSLRSLTHETADRLDRGQHRPARTSVMWARLSDLFRMINVGEPPLEISTFNGGLFDPERHPFLEQNTIGDAHLELALDLLARVDRSFVDYRDLATRHLGTIYEGLLEYHLTPLDEPEADEAGVSFTIALVNDKGERKTTGSFYTPDDIVEYIVGATLDSVVNAAVEDAESDEERIARILALNVLDPAMGSGHFLVEAIDYLAGRVARLDTGDGDAGGQDIAEWKRRVAQACIYGVDRNALAVQLAQLSIWLATAAKGRPLSFLGHHLHTGNSLVGCTLADVRAARAPAAAPRRTRRPAEDRRQTSFVEDPGFRGTLRDAVRSIDAIERSPATTVAEVKEQERLYAELREGLTSKFGHAMNVVTAIQYGYELEESLQAALVAYASDPAEFSMKSFPKHLRAAEQMKREVGFFHWEIEFPDVFFTPDGEPLGEGAGFHAVVGNPPYDVLAAKERGEDEDVAIQFLTYARETQSLAPVMGRKADLFRLFIAKGLQLVRPGGRLGYIVPMSLMADQQAKTLRRYVLANHRFITVDAFPQKDDPRRRVFVEAKLPTCIFTAAAHVPDQDAPIVVRIHPGRDVNEVSGEYRITPREIRSLDPDGQTIPLVTSDAAAAIRDKLRSAPGYCTMGDLFTSSQGEINEKTMEDAGYVSTDDDVGPKILRGSNIRRYRFDPEARQGEDKYLDVGRYHAEVGGDRAVHTQGRRFGYQRNSALDSSRRLLFAELPVPCYCFDSVAYIPTEDALKAGEPVYAWLALLNSDLLEWVFRLTSTNNHVSTDQLHRLPAIRASRKLPERTAAALDGLVAAIEAGAVASAGNLVTVVRSNLAAATPRVASAVHALDRLGRLRCALETASVIAVQRFREDLDGVLPPRKIEKLNRLWTPIRKDTADREEARQTLGPLAHEILEFSAAGRLTEPQWTWILRRRIPRLPHLADVMGAYRTHAPGLRLLTQQVDAAEDAINDIVFSAFGLTPDEIEVVRSAI